MHKCHKMHKTETSLSCPIFYCTVGLHAVASVPMAFPFVFRKFEMLNALSHKLEVRPIAL